MEEYPTRLQGGDKEKYVAWSWEKVGKYPPWL